MKNSRTVLLAALAVLFILQGVVHTAWVLPRWRRDYKPAAGLTPGGGLNPDQFLFALIGLREFIAGILWVRADKFFDTGNYDAILPIIRLVTWLDPKQIDVYSTGMWHVGYNFTDEEQRSDRRYLKPALALGKEGAANNPYTYEMFFETGWMWFHKIDDDYHQAVKWFEEAHKRRDIEDIAARKNLLAKAYERNVQLEDSLNLLVKLRNQAFKRFTDVGEADYTARQNVDTIEQNLDNLLVRMTQRGWLALKRNDGSYQAGDYDTKIPHEVGFSARVTVEEPRVLIVEGTWNVLPVGSRIRIMLRDAEYDSHKVAELDWDSATSVDIEPDRKYTVMQDGLFVRNGRFRRRIDMSKDPTMYPFNSKDYIIEFFYDPRGAPDHMKDKYGFAGEGFTDKNFLNTEIRPGGRVMYAKLNITREQLLQSGDWYGKVPVVKTSNYASAGQGAGVDEIVVLPSLRGGGGNKQ